MLKQAWFYVTLMAVAAVAFLLYSEFTSPPQVGGEPAAVARETGGPDPATAVPAGPPALEAAAGSSAPPAPSEAELAALGEQLYTQLACSACHSLDGTPLVGPSWAGLYGRQVRLASGETVIADEAYIREAIEDPDARIVEGYPQGVMTATLIPFRARLAEEGTIEALIAFIKTLE